MSPYALFFTPETCAPVYCADSFPERTSKHYFCINTLMWAIFAPLRTRRALTVWISYSNSSFFFSFSVENMCTQNIQFNWLRCNLQCSRPWKHYIVLVFHQNALLSSMSHVPLNSGSACNIIVIKCHVMFTWSRWYRFYSLCTYNSWPIRRPRRWTLSAASIIRESGGLSATPGYEKRPENNSRKPVS